MKYITYKDDLPSENHYAVLVFSTVYIPGDERSRTNPGHGYPAYNKQVVEYISFDCKLKLLEWIENQETRKYGKEKYQVIEVKPLKVNLNIGIELS